MPFEGFCGKSKSIIVVFAVTSAENATEDGRYTRHMVRRVSKGAVVFGCKVVFLARFGPPSGDFCWLVIG